MEDFLHGAMLAVISGVVLWVMSTIGGISERRDVANDCNDFGKVKIAYQWYECKPIEPKESAK